jgi:TPR repeat protein
MTRFAPIKSSFFSLLLISACLLGMPAQATDPQTQMENKAFKEAVKAVKNKNYAHAITLFEAQAKMPRHDAQHNLAVLLNAGKGRPRNYVEALFWSWQAQLGGIDDAEDLANDIVDLLPPKVADGVRDRVGEALQARIDANDLKAIPQFANYHLTILTEPDYGNAYIWYSIAAAINLPETSDARDDAESQIDSKNLVELQMKTQTLFDKYKFKPLPTKGKGEENES